MEPEVSYSDFEVPLVADGIHITILPALFDNYMYLLACGGDALVIDPSDAKPVLEVLEAQDLTLKTILNTHHHQDHVAGNDELKAATGCVVMGPDHPDIPGLDRALGEGDRLAFRSLNLHVLSTPGHGPADISFHGVTSGDSASSFLWCGDTLFCGGCGRLLGGTASQLWASLSRLAALPDTTRVYCGHEYTLDNLEFALSVDPENVDLHHRLREVKAARRRKRPSVPSTIGEEKKTNPFLRAGRPEMAEQLGVRGADPLAVFTELRARKDHF